MKTRIIKSLLTLVMAVITLPMLSQDYMNIFFKNGTTKTYHLDGVKSFETTKIDSEGIRHADYKYQHVTTDNDDFVYLIEDVDSIVFTKFNKEQNEENISSAMTDLLPVLGDCNSIYEVSNIIETIQDIETIDKAWIDGETLFVKIRDWTTIAFDFSYNDRNSLSLTELKDLAQNTIAKSRKINNDSGDKLKAVIANQQHYDMSEWRELNISGYLYPLKKEFDKAGYDTEYLECPTLDFFCSDMFNYDVVFLITHGGYWEPDKQHVLLCGDRLGEIPCTIGNVNGLSKEETTEFYNQYERIFDNPLYTGREDQITLIWRIETRFYNGIEGYYWVAYPVIYESFFKYTAIGKFSNLNSILVNAACQSLKHDNNLADIFFDYRNLGTYLGYNESNTFGQRAGSHLLSSMLKGVSAEKAYKELGGIEAVYNKNNTVITGTYLNEDVKEYKDNGKLDKAYNAELLILYNDKKETKNLFITPIFTKQREHNEVMEEYYLNKSVMISAMTTTLDPIALSMGFEYGTNKNNLNKKILSGTQFNTFDNGEGSYCFASLLEDIEFDKTYYYRGYTYDGEYYNYGNICSFKIDKLPDLEVSNTSLTIELGNVGNIKISGSGYFEAISSDTKTITVSINNLREGHANLIIETHKVGPATITVTDTKTKQTKKIEVTVTPKYTDLQLSTTKLSLVEGSSGTVSITAGNGEYGVTNLNSDIAKATLNGTTITIEALAVGDAKVVVTDIKTDKKETIEITVTKKTDTSDIALSTQEVYLNVGETKQIEVTAGSGNYSVWVYTPEVADVTVNGNIITIKALSAGKTIVKVTDTTTNKTITFGIQVSVPSAYDKDAVDLGLSVKWAKMNVGAVSEEDCGEHYAWGETESKSYFSWSSYEYCNGNQSTISKYNSHDGKTMLEPSDDAAHVIMGGNWRTPTLAELEELVNQCTWTQETLNGVHGARVTGPNGKSIFLPYGGEMYEDQLSHYDMTGYYYASTLSANDEQSAPALVCFGNKQEFVGHARYFGLSIRGVLSK